MIARSVPLASFLGDDLKHVISIEGIDMTGEAATFALARYPGATPILRAMVTLLAVLEVDPGVPTSVLEVFVPAATVQSAFAQLMPSGGSDMGMAWEFRLVPFPDDVGTAAVTTFLFGTYTMKATVNG